MPQHKLFLQNSKFWFRVILAPSHDTNNVSAGEHDEAQSRSELPRPSASEAPAQQPGKQTSADLGGCSQGSE